MDHWAKQVKEVEDITKELSRINPVQYERLHLHLLAKYVDDVLVIPESLRRGVRWSSRDRAFIWTKEAYEEDKDLNSELVTMNAVRTMASDLLKCLNFTSDCPSQNVGGRMPVLDTAVWIGTPEREWGVLDAMKDPEIQLPTRTGRLKKVVLYVFYRKTMANNMPMHQRAAAPNQDKVQTCSNEFIRRLKNTSRSLKATIVEQVIKEYVWDLKRGGFSATWSRLV